MICRYPDERTIRRVVPVNRVSLLIPPHRKRVIFAPRYRYIVHMTYNRAYLPILILLALCMVFMAGCTSKAPEPAPSSLPTTAHAVKTAYPTVTEPATETVEQVTAAPALMETASDLSKPIIMTRFSEDGVAMSYPDRFRLISDSSLEKMRSIAEPQGINIITILTATDSKDSIQVTRQDANSSIESMYTDKQAISDEITANGSATVMGMTFVKYMVEKQSLPDGTEVVRILAENTEKGTAATYLLCKSGAVYNVNFIYESPQRAESQAAVRDEVMQTVQLA